MSANSFFNETLSLMSGNVVRLPVKPRPEAKDRDHQFYCLKCDGEAFNLFANGSVRCLKCGAAINNLSITRKE